MHFSMHLKHKRGGEARLLQEYEQRTTVGHAKWRHWMSVHVCMYVCMYVCMCVYVCVCVCAYM